MTDVRAARSALRGIQERWEQIGAVPRDAREHLEAGLRRVEDAVRKVEETQWRRSNPEALARAEGTVAQLRSTIAQLERQLAQARDRGDDRAAASAEEALTARRAWSPKPSTPWPNSPPRSGRVSAGHPVDAVDGANGAQYVPEVLRVACPERKVEQGRHARRGTRGSDRY